MSAAVRGRIAGSGLNPSGAASAITITNSYWAEHIENVSLGGSRLHE